MWWMFELKVFISWIYISEILSQLLLKQLPHISDWFYFLMFMLEEELSYIQHQDPFSETASQSSPTVTWTKGYRSTL